jgi:hypothetical protein
MINLILSFTFHKKEPHPFAIPPSLVTLVQKN